MLFVETQILLITRWNIHIKLNMLEYIVKSILSKIYNIIVFVCFNGSYNFLQTFLLDQDQLLSLLLLPSNVKNPSRKKERKLFILCI